MLVGLFVIQFALVFAGAAKLTFVAGLHAVNAVVLVTYAAWTIRRSWAFGPNGLVISTRAAGNVGTGEQPA